MTKIIAIASAAMLCVAISATALAQNAQNMRIGVVNLARLLDESPQARSAMGALQEEFAPRQRELVSKQTELKDKQEQLQRDLEVTRSTAVLSCGIVIRFGIGISLSDPSNVPEGVISRFRTASRP